MNQTKQIETEAERKARITAQSAQVKRILGGFKAPKARKTGTSARAFMATFSNQGGVR